MVYQYGNTAKSKYKAHWWPYEMSASNRGSGAKLSSVPMFLAGGGRAASTDANGAGLTCFSSGVELVGILGCAIDLRPGLTEWSRYVWISSSPRSTDPPLETPSSSANQEMRSPCTSPDSQIEGIAQRGD